MEARRDDQDCLGKVLTPPLYRAPECLQDGRAKVADGEGMVQARMDGEDQRQMMKPGDCGSERDDGEVFAEVHVHQVGPQGEDGGDDRRLGSVELANAPQGESHSYNARVVAETLEIRRGRRACGQHCLNDAVPVERSGQLGGVVLHPPRGSNFTPLPTSAEGGGSKTEQSLSTLIRLRSVLLISQESPEEPIATFSPRPPLHTTLISLLVGQRGVMCEGECPRERPS